MNLMFMSCIIEYVNSAIQSISTPMKYLFIACVFPYLEVYNTVLGRKILQYVYCLLYIHIYRHFHTDVYKRTYICAHTFRAQCLPSQTCYLYLVCDYHKSILNAYQGQVYYIIDIGTMSFRYLLSTMPYNHASIMSYYYIVTLDALSY